MALRCKKCGKVTRDKLQTTFKNFLKKQCCPGCKSTQFTEIDTVSFDFYSLVFISDFIDTQSSFPSDSDEGMRIPHEIDTHKSTLHEYVAPRICEEPITHRSNFDSHSHTHYDHHSSFSDSSSFDNSSSYDSSSSCDSSSCDCGSSCD